MSKLLNIKLSNDRINLKYTSEKGKLESNAFKSYKNFQTNISFDARQKNQKLNHSINHSPNKSMQKRLGSDKNISYLFLDPNQSKNLFFPSQFNKYKELINLSQKKLSQSIKKSIKCGNSQIMNQKIKNFEIPVQISQSIDLIYHTPVNQKSFTATKMPDLLKIKLKKQLETIQKDHKNKKQKLNSSKKIEIKDRKKNHIFFDKKLDKSSQIKQEQKIIEQKSNKQNLIERRLRSVKKYDKIQKSKKSFIVGQLNLVNSKQKKIITESADQSCQKNQKKKPKLSQLVEYGKQSVKNRLNQNRNKRANRIKTESAIYSTLITADGNYLQLQGTKIKQETILSSEELELNLLLQKSKLREWSIKSSSNKQNKSIVRKQNNSPDFKQKSKEKQENNLFTKTHDISPWINIVQYGQHGFY